MLVTMLLFIILIWLLCGYASYSKWGDPRSWIIIPMSALFIWVVQLGVRKIIHGWAMTIDGDGFTIPGPAFRSKRIRWDDVEKIGAFYVGRTHFTGIRLEDTARLVAQYSPEETRIILRREAVFRYFSPRVPRPKNMADYFANRKVVYGYDILLAGAERDRGAEEFAQYLEGFRLPSCGSVTHA